MDKKQLLLDAALKLFVEYGFHGTPTSLIAKEAGVANGTLFHYFKTKDELIVALYVDIKSRMSAYVFENAKGQKTFKETVKEQYLASLFWALDNQLQFRFVEQFKNSPYLSQIAPDEIEASVKPFHDMLRKGIKEKIIKPHPVDLLFTIISSQTYGINQYLISNNFSKAKQHQVISDSFEMLWAMIT
jgi:AcrR family transcriptional regulator